MFRCKPERNPKQVTLIMLTFVTAFIATAVLVCSVNSYKWIFELLLIIVLSAGIMAVYRYSMTEMEYEIFDGSFSVIKVVGQKRTVVCSLSLSTAIMLIPKAEYTEKLKAGQMPVINSRYNFNQNMKCKSYVYICEFNGKTIMVEFEPNEIFVRVMLEEIERAKKNDQNPDKE
ncbi:MAG: hypothetical protein GX148_04420 [Clostridiales bacterium]|nr:hypothetical protein [Clostridiales bacterium]